MFQPDCCPQREALVWTVNEAPARVTPPLSRELRLRCSKIVNGEEMSHYASQMLLCSLLYSKNTRFTTPVKVKMVLKLSILYILNPRAVLHI